MYKLSITQVTSMHTYLYYTVTCTLKTKHSNQFCKESRYFHIEPTWFLGPLGFIKEPVIHETMYSATLVPYRTKLNML